MTAPFELIRDASTSGTGVVIVSYERRGEAKTGSFALERKRREQLTAEN